MKLFKIKDHPVQSWPWWQFLLFLFLLLVFVYSTAPLLDVFANKRGHLPGLAVEPLLYQHKTLLLAIAVLVFWRKLSIAWPNRALLLLTLLVTLVLSAEYRLFKLITLLVFMAEIVTLFYLNVVRNTSLKARKKNIFSLLFSLVFSFSLLEMLFMYIPQSHGVGYTLGSRLWDEYYWKPVNRQGYRDDELNKKDSTKTKIFVLGDSFTAGHGIKRAEDRFSNVLEKNTKGYSVYNLGVNGADTRSEYDSLMHYPLQPDVLVLQYFGNDIEGALKSHGQAFGGFLPYEDLNTFARILVESSHLLNYVYWQFPHFDTRPYADYVMSGYASQQVMNTHLQDLYRFVKYSRDKNIPLYVLLFPLMQKPVEASEFYLRPVGDFFKKNGVQVLDVSELTKDLEPHERLVNQNDAHANGKVHERLGKKLASIITWSATAH